jgi:hypothetical protein
MAAGHHFLDTLDSDSSLHFLDKGHQLANLCGDSYLQVEVLLRIAQLKWHIGDYCTAILHASQAQRLSKLSGYLYLEA